MYVAVIASEAKQSILSLRFMDCFAALAMTIGFSLGRRSM
jgi:hypothetical protein